MMSQVQFQTNMLSGSFMTTVSNSFSLFLCPSLFHALPFFTCINLVSTVLYATERNKICITDLFHSVNKLSHGE